VTAHCPATAEDRAEASLRRGSGRRQRSRG
jgi:hypothetical protein